MPEQLSSNKAPKKTNNTAFLSWFFDVKWLPKIDQASSFFKEMAWGLFFKLPVLPKIYHTEKRAEELIEISKAERGAYTRKHTPSESPESPKIKP